MLASVIREVIAPVIRDCPPECGIVSITDVTVSPEYSVVTVSISALREPKLALKFLSSRSRELRGLLGGLRLRKVPELRFTIDRIITQGDRIDELLRMEEQKKSGDTSRDVQG